ncbi:cell wall-binding repeat-containing protein [Metaclostridioides mangenotii]|uniref:cell wall-binding repeat-containing protein n=1 Tax=Metaclostridioides mangenotii TaxID=1540 RepID=UPI0028E32D91|nr:cell wall-binding repeat-containing protein [Clostridioides mangenotii]
MNLKEIKKVGALLVSCALIVPTINVSALEGVKINQKSNIVNSINEPSIFDKDYNDKSNKNKKIVTVLQDNKSDSEVISKEETDIIEIPDENLKVRLKKELGITEDSEITKTKLETIQSLDLSKSGVTNLEGLQEAISMTRLNLSENNLNDFDVLNILVGKIYLQEIDLSKNNITMVESIPLDVSTLDLSNNGITEISSSSNILSISDLNLSHNQIDDVSWLKQYNGSTLDLSFNLITGENIVINELKASLDSWNLSNNQIKDLSWLNQVNNIDKLDLSYNGIEDTELMTNSNEGSYINHLDLSNNKIENLTWIDNFIKIYTLDVSDNVLTDVVIENTSDKYKNINTLYLSNAKISDLSWISNFTNLNNLDISNNGIQDENIISLDNNESISQLNISYNELKKLDWVARFPRLYHLYSTNNKINDISYIKKTEQSLYVLDLSNNELEDVSPLTTKESFYYQNLDLSGNKIADISSLKKLLLNNPGYYGGIKIKNQRIDLAKKNISKNLEIDNMIKFWNGNIDNISPISDGGIYKDGKIVWDNLNDQKEVSFGFSKTLKYDYSHYGYIEFSGKVIQPLTVKEIPGGGGNGGGNGEKPDPLPPAPPTGEITGEDRYDTAGDISKDWDKAEYVVLANGSSIVDAMTATPFAYAKNAPILLTERDTLNVISKSELKRLETKTVYLIGGENTLAQNVKKQLVDMGIKVERIHGEDRFGTSIELAKKIDGLKDITEIALVKGENP